MSIARDKCCGNIGERVAIVVLVSEQYHQIKDPCGGRNISSGQARGDLVVQVEYKVYLESRHSIQREEIDGGKLVVKSDTAFQASISGSGRAKSHSQARIARG